MEDMIQASARCEYIQVTLEKSRCTRKTVGWILSITCVRRTEVAFFAQSHSHMIIQSLDIK